MGVPPASCGNQVRQYGRFRRFQTPRICCIAQTKAWAMSLQILTGATGTKKTGTHVFDVMGCAIYQGVNLWQKSWDRVSFQKKITRHRIYRKEILRGSLGTIYQVYFWQSLLCEGLYFWSILIRKGAGCERGLPPSP